MAWHSLNEIKSMGYSKIWSIESILLKISKNQNFNIRTIKADSVVENFVL